MQIPTLTPDTLYHRSGLTDLALGASLDEIEDRVLRLAALLSAQDTLGADYLFVNTARMAPATAGGLTLGTAALPWGVGHFKSQIQLYDSAGTARGLLDQAVGPLRISNAGSNDIIFRTNSTDRWLVQGTLGHFLAVTDNTYDIGASGANRPRDVFVGRKLTTVDSNRFQVDDGSTNKAGVAGTVVSTLDPSGDYPEGTLWCKV